MKEETLDRSFEDDLKIDMFALDDEWVRQATLYMRYSEMADNCSRELADLKDEYNVLRAETELAIRDHSIDVGVAKLTENVIKAGVEANVQVISLKKDINAKKWEGDIYSSAVKSFEHKKKGLESLVTLNSVGYFSEPRPPKGVEVDTSSKSSQNQKDGLNKRAEDRIKNRNKKNN